MTSPDMPFVCGRRAALLAAGVVGVAGLTACSSSATSAGSDQGGAGGAAVGGKDLAKTADIPVGGGKVFPAAGTVITQPTAGDFKAFSDICTHAGGIIDEVRNGVMQCPIHGSEFSVKDGSVVLGPATEPLPAMTVTVSGGSISVA